MNWVPYGPRALLFRFAETVGEEALARQQAIVADLERDPPAGLVEFVPAFTTILLEFDPRIVHEPERVAQSLAHRFEAAARVSPAVTPVLEIPVRYDGEDLADLARDKGLMAEEAVRLHCAPVYRVYMLGFSPGFPYLGELDPRLHTPRLASPRTRVAAGAVAVGGRHTGIYTVDGPGGWNVIGHTCLRLFDSEQDGEAMFRLRAGDRVRFVPEDRPGGLGPK